MIFRLFLYIFGAIISFGLGLYFARPLIISTLAAWKFRRQARLNAGMFCMQCSNLIKMQDKTGVVFHNNTWYHEHCFREVLTNH